MRLADRSPRHLAILTALALTIGSALAVGGFAVTSAGAAAAATSLCPDANVAAFGPNVCVFNDTMTQAAIQADLDAIATQQVPVASQFDGNRYAILFQPGSYGSKANPLVFQVGLHRGRGPRLHAAGHGHQRRHRRIQQPVHAAHLELQLR